MHYAVKSWNELLSANTNKLKSSNSLCHRREALPYLAYTGQVCAAEHKVLSINQRVELYYFNSKNLSIYFINLIVKFYFHSKFA